jgi:hypothetical protein
VVKPVPGIRTPAAHSADPRLDNLSRLFGIKPDKTPLENLQDQIKKEKPHGENAFSRLFRKSTFSSPKKSSHAITAVLKQAILPAV